MKVCAALCASYIDKHRFLSDDNTKPHREMIVIEYLNEVLHSAFKINSGLNVIENVWD